MRTADSVRGQLDLEPTTATRLLSDGGEESVSLSRPTHSRTTSSWCGPAGGSTPTRPSRRPCSAARSPGRAGASLSLISLTIVREFGPRRNGSTSTRARSSALPAPDPDRETNLVQHPRRCPSLHRPSTTRRLPVCVKRPVVDATPAGWASKTRGSAARPRHAAGGQNRAEEQTGCGAGGGAPCPALLGAPAIGVPASDLARQGPRAL